VLVSDLHQLFSSFLYLINKFLVACNEVSVLSVYSKCELIDLCLFLLDCFLSYPVLLCHLFLEFFYFISGVRNIIRQVLYVKIELVIQY